MIKRGHVKRDGSDKKETDQKKSDNQGDIREKLNEKDRSVSTETGQMKKWTNQRKAATGWMSKRQVR